MSDRGDGQWKKKKWALFLVRLRYVSYRFCLLIFWFRLPETEPEGEQVCTRAFADLSANEPVQQQN